MSTEFWKTKCGPTEISAWQRQAERLRTRFESVADEYRQQSDHGAGISFALVQWQLPSCDELGKFNCQRAIWEINKGDTSDSASEPWSCIRIPSINEGQWTCRSWYSTLPGCRWVMSQPIDQRDRLTKFRLICQKLFDDGDKLLERVPFRESIPLIDRRKQSGGWLSTLFESSWGPAHSFGLKSVRMFSGGGMGFTAIPYIEGLTIEGDPPPISLGFQWASLQDFGGKQPECFFCISQDVLNDSAHMIDWLLSLCNTAAIPGGDEVERCFGTPNSSPDIDVRAVLTNAIKVQSYNPSDSDNLPERYVCDLFPCAKDALPVIMVRAIAGSIYKRQIFGPGVNLTRSTYCPTDFQMATLQRVNVSWDAALERLVVVAGCRTTDVELMDAPEILRRLAELENSVIPEINDAGAGEHGKSEGEPLTTLRDCDRKAGRQYDKAMDHAAEMERELVTYDEAYDHYCEYLKDEGEKIPRRDSWKRFVSKFLRANGRPKYAKGGGVETRSVVRSKSKNRTKTDRI